MGILRSFMNEPIKPELVVIAGCGCYHARVWELQENTAPSCGLGSLSSRASTSDSEFKTPSYRNPGTSVTDAGPDPSTQIPNPRGFILKREEDRYDTQIDLWSVGVTLFELSSNLAHAFKVEGFSESRV